VSADRSRRPSTTAAALGRSARRAELDAYDPLAGDLELHGRGGPPLDPERRYPPR